MESKTTDDIPVPKKPKVNTMRNHWFAHVAKTRKRLQKASKPRIMIFIVSNLRKESAVMEEPTASASKIVTILIK